MHNDGDEVEQRNSAKAAELPGLFGEITGAASPPGYSIIRKLGQGSMAHVFLARNETLMRLVAIKVLRGELSADAVARKRFVREAQAAARISHPSVISIFTVGSLGNDYPFIEMQYVDGSNLAQLLRAQGRFSVHDARTLLTQLSGALAAAHESGIIHRDVKPANVLLEHESGRVYLTDFGVAGILESGSEAVTHLTREGDRLGDPTYMSPEQLRGDPPTPQSDVYSLGIIGYEMLTMHGPFGDAEIADVASAHFRRAPVDLQSAYPEIPPYLSDLLMRCLAKRPEHRPTAAALNRMLSKESSDLLPRGAGSASTDSGALAGFLHELKQRKVYRSGVAYGVVIFAVLQGADLILPALTAPEWVYRTVVVASLAGLPVVLALAWVFDLRDGRLERTDADSATFAVRASPGLRVFLQAIGMVLSIAVSAGIAWWLLAS